MRIVLKANESIVIELEGEEEDFKITNGNSFVTVRSTQKDDQNRKGIIYKREVENRPVRKCSSDNS